MTLSITSQRCETSAIHGVATKIEQKPSLPHSLLHKVGVALESARNQMEASLPSHFLSAKNMHTLHHFAVGACGATLGIAAIALIHRLLGGNFTPPLSEAAIIAMGSGLLSASLASSPLTGNDEIVELEWESNSLEAALAHTATEAFSAHNLRNETEALKKVTEAHKQAINDDLAKIEETHAAIQKSASQSRLVALSVREKAKAVQSIRGNAENNLKATQADVSLAKNAALAATQAQNQAADHAARTKNAYDAAGGYRNAAITHLTATRELVNEAKTAADLAHNEQLKEKAAGHAERANVERALTEGYRNAAVTHLTAARGALNEAKTAADLTHSEKLKEKAAGHAERANVEHATTEGYRNAAVNHLTATRELVNEAKIAADLAHSEKLKEKAAGHAERANTERRVVEDHRNAAVTHLTAARGALNEAKIAADLAHSEQLKEKAAGHAERANTERRAVEGHRNAAVAHLTVARKEESEAKIAADLAQSEKLKEKAADHAKIAKSEHHAIEDSRNAAVAHITAARGDVAETKKIAHSMIAEQLRSQAATEAGKTAHEGLAVQALKRQAEDIKTAATHDLMSVRAAAHKTADIKQHGKAVVKVAVEDTQAARDHKVVSVKVLEAKK